MVVTLGQQQNVGEKPTVILYTYIIRHAGTPEKQQKQKPSDIFSSEGGMLRRLRCVQIFLKNNLAHHQTW